MPLRTRIPFWTTILATLALGACLHEKEQQPAASGGEGPGDAVETAPVPTGSAVSTKVVQTAPVSNQSAVSGEGSQPAPAPDGSAMHAEAEEVAPVADAATSSRWGARGREQVAQSTPAAPATVAAKPPPPVEHPLRHHPEPEEGPVALPMAQSEVPASRHEVVDGVVRGGTVGGVVSGVISSTTTPALVPVDGPVPVVPSQANAEEYTDYGVNGFVATAKDPLSTFSVDVDTASYEITRRKLKEGYLPPPAAVRVEEFVNYFPYEYEHPAAGRPFAVDFEAAPSPWNARHDIVRIGVQGRRVSYDRRKPVHLTFLVDVSGSMRSPDKLDLVKKSLDLLTDALQDGDTVAVATYAGNTAIVLQPTPATQKRTIEAALQRLTAGGSTAMSSGIDLAYRLADASYAQGAVNRVIVCSDGDANVGPSTHEALSKQIHGYAEKGITLTTLGFGNEDFRDTMMEQLADDGDGNYYYIDSSIEARRVLVDKMTSTMEVIAKDVKIQVDWNPADVLAYRLIGYENRDIADKDFRNDAVDAGEIGSGHQVTALYEVALADHPTGDLATVRVRNKAPGPDSPAVERSFGLPVSAIKESFAEGSDQFRLAVAAASFAEILRGSPYVRGVTLRDVQAVARGAQRPEYPEDAELVDLIGRAARLKGEGAYSER